jgi:SAM-dependent methyltransferase
VCDRESDLVVWTEKEYEGRSCACGTVFVSPEPSPDAIDITADGHPDAFYKTYAGFKARWIERIRPNGRLLEVGCGDGHFLAAAKSRGYDVAGLEPHPERAKRSRARLGVEIRCGRVEEIEWPGASFDIVYHCDMLAHFHDPRLALNRMCDLLAPAGILAFEVGILGGINPAWYPRIGGIGLPQHRWLYSDQSMQILLKQAGLRVTHNKRFGLGPVVLLHEGIRRIAGIARRKTRGAKGEEEAASPSHTSPRTQLLERVEQFFRYRVGSLTPYFGPATLLIAAEQDL